MKTWATAARMGEENRFMKTWAPATQVLLLIALTLVPRGQAAAAPPPVKTVKPVTITTVVNDSTIGAGINQCEYSGSWTHGTSGDCVYSYLGDHSWANADGAYMQVRFFGTRMRLYGKRAAHQGVGIASMDGEAETEVDFVAPTNEYKALVYESPELACTGHVFKLQVQKGFIGPDYLEIDAPRGTPVDVAIAGFDSLPVPKAESIRVSYAARIVNNYGTVMPNEPATWSLREPVKGIAIEPSTGAVTIDSTAVVGSAFTLVATVGERSAARKVTLTVPTSTHSLATEDTRLTVSVLDNRLYITSLKNPEQGWDWVATGVGTTVPFPSNIAAKAASAGVPTPLVNWNYLGHNLDTTNGVSLTLTFASVSPNLELRSVWRARPGVGPVEHRISVINRTGDPVVFQGDDTEAANLSLLSDTAVRFLPGDAAQFGYGESKPLPYQILQAGSMHGIYVAYDYGCGQYRARRDDGNPLRINCRFWVGNRVSTGIAPGETYHLPGIMIQTYKGDPDDAANHFRRWFWTHEITPSLRNNPNEPPIVTAYPPPYDGMVDYLIKEVNTKNFAAMGIRHLKTDAWYNRAGHAKSDELAAACHSNNLTVGLYWDGQISDDVLRKEFAKSSFDYYRMDQYQRGVPFHVNDYHSVQAFNAKIDAMIALGAPNWRFENCCNGGNLRTLDLCRRMTFMTHSDDDRLLTWFNHVYHWSYLICPIQLRNDYNIGGKGQQFGAPNDIAHVRGLLLGAFYAGSPHWWTPTDIENLKHAYRLYNERQRPILRGADVYRILPPPANGQWFGLQYHNTFINKGSVLLWQNGGPASQVVKLKGLDRSKTYLVTFEDAKDKNGEMTGAHLMEKGLDVPMGPNASEIVWVELAPGVRR